MLTYNPEKSQLHTPAGNEELVRTGSSFTTRATATSTLRFWFGLYCVLTRGGEAYSG